jgi:hypothetical protein
MEELACVYRLIEEFNAYFLLKKQFIFMFLWFIDQIGAKNAI